ncbi:PASTA domain-containing protein [Micromonospora sp. WMMA1998]|uniref:PASTA domain-containing protein n=1 Tax=Micromonospora sp. WMMA1998 TaxID=3015167 RepID=UPI00248D07C0|nr:PASTA domain-containing protein [Micromonospora sp. WMMA1998]WBC13214.1 PASTA domain-containing protein [Micromonospora sp. WMMA1998]
MTDDRQPVRDDGTGPGRTRLFLGGALAVVLLAVIGASGGWVLAGEPDPPAASSGSTPTGAVPTSAPPETPSAPSPRPADDRPSGPRRTPSGLTVPDLVGADFARARQELRDRRLGWRLVFGAGSGRTVERTSPGPGEPVKRGVTVTVWVAGPAPAVTVPEVGALSCADAADDLVEAGLYPRYRSGRQGPVTGQEPAAGSAARWNDQIALTCGDAPTASPSPTP